MSIRDFKWKDLRFRQILSSVITGLGLIYLLLVLSGRIAKDRLGQTEVAIFITITLLNSEMIERLSKFQLGKDGMTVELEEKVQNVKEEQEKISDVQKEQQEEIEHIAGFLLRGCLESSKEYQYIEKLSGVLG
jgi:ABC-type transport system involved in cytochrome bd biosynthesis fused ATPase/permease subunit